MKLLSLFSGIGSFEKALERQEIRYELVNYCEIDKYASNAYSAIHNISEELNLGNIVEVDVNKLLDFDLMTWGFPCQDISIAGDQKGIIKDKTRSGLYYYGLDILKHKKPKYSIVENVKNLVGKKFKKTFKQILWDFENAGYNNYWKVLNAKHFGVPQERERVFIISIRKDADNGKFEFPIGFKSNIKMLDLLEDDVDGKYYIRQEKVKEFVAKLKDKTISNVIRTGGYGSMDRHSWDLVCTQINRGNAKIKDDNICSCIDANYYKSLDNHASRTGIMQLGMLNIKGNEQTRRVYAPEGLSPTLSTMQGGNRQPKVIINYLIRKLTPLECWRLMGFDDEDYWIAKKSLEKTFYNGKDRSNSQMYKMAGNSIVINVLEHIFTNLFKEAFD